MNKPLLIQRQRADRAEVLRWDGRCGPTLRKPFGGYPHNGLSVFFSPSL
jgi:hypothetical protein